MLTANWDVDRVGAIRQYWTIDMMTYKGEFKIERCIESGSPGKWEEISDLSDLQLSGWACVKEGMPGEWVELPPDPAL